MQLEFYIPRKYPTNIAGTRYEKNDSSTHSATFDDSIIILLVFPVFPVNLHTYVRLTANDRANYESYDIRYVLYVYENSEPPTQQGVKVGDTKFEYTYRSFCYLEYVYVYK